MKILLVDANFLAWRAHHSTGNLSHNGSTTGVAFGFLKEILALQELHRPDRIVFCFDSKHSKRKEVFPEYKDNRVYDEHHREVCGQIKRLRKEILPGVGFRNVFVSRGFEADDLVAALALALAKGDEAVIVASDKDFYQLLSKRVSIWNPMKRVLYTRKAFREEWGLERPSHWVTVKAIAGCGTDNVKGIEGVGERTACKYLNGTLKEGSAKWKAIKSTEGLAVWNRNLRLVGLPFEGLAAPVLRDDEISAAKWIAWTGKLGFASMAKSVSKVEGLFKSRKK
jgi:DNA polymerase-1